MNTDEIVKDLRGWAKSCMAVDTRLVARLVDAADLIESLQAKHKQAALNYQQKCRDVVELEAQLTASQRRGKAARNELCLKCGRYRDAHKGACDGCRWMA